MWQYIHLCKAGGSNTFTETEAVTYILLPGEWEGYIWFLSRINKHHHFISADLNMFFGNCLMNFSCQHKAWYINIQPEGIWGRFYPLSHWLGFKGICLHVIVRRFDISQGHWIHDNQILPLTEANGIGLKKLKADMASHLSSQKS